MSRKRQLAVEWSVEGLLEAVAGGILRLWTLTTRDVIEDPRELGARWSAFNKMMAEYLDGRCAGHARHAKARGSARRWGGVRVSEPHPKGHGWHIHFVTASWIAVDDVRRIAEIAGFGRVHVAKPGKGGAAAIGRYLSKYLGKALDAGKGTGARMWSIFGYGRDKATRLKDIEVTFPGRSVWANLYQAAKQLGADHWTAFCQAEHGTFRWWWADITGEGPDILVNPF